MSIHAGEVYFNSDVPEAHFTKDKWTFWVGVYNSVCRPSVPLFVMMSGYLILPVKTNIPTFLKRRFTRVLFPFFFWCIAYSFYHLARGEISVADAFLNIPKIFVNYGTTVGHLWYIYMQIGIYLFAPIMTPWIKQASMEQFYYYFLFWGISLLIGFIHVFVKYIWGECYWNNTPMFQEFTGFFGYAVLGVFIKLHLKDHNLYIVGAIFVVVGYVVTVVLFEAFSIKFVTCAELDVSWSFNSINVAMYTFGIFILLRKVQCTNAIVTKIINDIALKSYGIYCVHMMFLQMFVYLYDSATKTPLIFIPVVALSTFVASYIAIKIISYIPYSEYIIG